jgi:hypothetical protein
MADSGKTAIDTASSFLNGVDLKTREKSVLEDVTKKTGFVVLKTIWESTYYGSNQIGAILYKGQWQNQSAILKIQGVKPELSEIVMVDGFALQNKSLLVRPPKFYATLPWDDGLEYEAIVMEEVLGKKVIDSKQLQTEETLNTFFKIYEEYRLNCINTPWIGTPGDLISGGEEVEKLKKMLLKLKPESPLRKNDDWALAERARAVINKVWLGKKSQFMHGHFSAEDLIYQGNEVVLFSNLFWKWKHKFYDAVFAYHYCMINLSHIKEVDPMVFDSQRKLWLQKIEGLRLVENDDDQKMLKAALLERMVACLLIDGIVFVNESSPVANHLLESTRVEIERLVKELE